MNEITTLDKIVEKYRKWRKENPDEDYRYDQIYDFVDVLPRGELLRFFEELCTLYKSDITGR